MRTARRRDYWRRVYGRTYEIRVERAEYESVLGVGSGSVSFTGPISVICGANGVGSRRFSTPWWLVWTRPKTTSAPTFRRRMTDSVVRMHLTASGDSESYKVEYDSAGHPLDTPERPLTVVDASEAAPALISWAADEKNIDELLDAYGPRELDADERQILSFLVGRSTTRSGSLRLTTTKTERRFPTSRSCLVASATPCRPWVVGRHRSSSCYWTLRNVPGDSILLIEEPESFIAARSQSALMDVIAKFALERGLWVVVTTHAAGVLAAVPREHVNLVFRESGAVHVKANPTDQDLSRAVGLPLKPPVVVLVEDRVAEALLRSIVRLLRPGLVHQLDIRIAGSIDNVVKALELIPKAGQISHIGVLDGDARERVRESGFEHAFLPGLDAPERFLRDAAAGKAPALADRLGVPPADLALLMSNLEGEEHHDWLRGLCNGLGRTTVEVVDQIVRVWIDEAGTEECETMLTVLENAAGHSSPLESEL